jgi:hypothetical protein
MSKQLVGLDDLYPDGIAIQVSWDAWAVGMSIFVPCTGLNRAGRQARIIAKRKGYTLAVRSRTEDGFLGVRIWRTT